jgi:F-type H+-transporting ATPase subunit delta
MLASPLARVYSEALFGIAKERGVVDEIGQELQAFLELVSASPDVERFLDTPVLEPSVKVTHLRTALEGRASDVVTDFLCLVVEKRRAGALRSIVEAYHDQADELAGRARVSVRTAAPLPDGLRRELEEVLRSSLDKEIVLEPEVEPALLGGAVVGIGDRLYDGSVRNRISQFRKQIMRSGGYEAQG